MKYILIAMLITAMNTDSCKNKNRLPPCVQQKIDQIKAQPKWNPPAEVNEYTYEGRQVFLFTSDCCDRYIELFDSNCNYLCAPSGGYTGRGDNKCSKFYDEAEHVRLVWKDGR
jgi:hypothetical protein